MLDPIADKAIVLITLTALIGAMGTGGWLLVPASIIIFREVFVSGVCEYVAGQKLQLKVTQLAKWKTTFQLVALGALIFGGAVHGQPCQSVDEACRTLAEGWVHLVGLASLWLAAILTCVTGWDYLRVGLKHMD